MFVTAVLSLLSLSQAQANVTFDAGKDPILAKHPTVNATEVVFEFAGDLWKVAKVGGEATKLTNSTAGTAEAPIFSPDGTQIAFTAQYDGNRDAYVMPAEGGMPTRLTAHPGNDYAVGWTPDGKSVLIKSDMLSNTGYTRLFTVPIEGGVPKALPFPAGVQGCFSPDGQEIAYVPNPKWQEAWKRYRGGQTTPIWIGKMSDSHVEAVPRENTNDSYPMWVGDSIYYLSDPTGPVGINQYDVNSHRTKVVIPGQGFDIKSATAGFGEIAYEKLGSIHLYDLKSGQDHTVPITMRGDFPQARTEWKSLQGNITSVYPSPSGQRVAVTARGWLFTVPAKKGDTRLIGEEQGVDRKNATWSPDGKTLAYTRDDRDGERLVLRNLATSVEKVFALGDPPGEYTNFSWSPDSTHLAYTDNKLNLWLMDVAFGVSKKIDTGTYRASTHFAPNWSPDSKWLTYTHDKANYFNIVVLYSLATGKITELSDALADASGPVFDRSGKYLYFLASTDEGLGIDSEDIVALGTTNVSHQVYGVLLQSGTPNPFTPQSDEEKLAAEAKPVGKSEADPDLQRQARPAAAPDGEKVKPKSAPMPDIDLEDIRHRTFPIPLPRADYTFLVPGSEGSFFVGSSPARLTSLDRRDPGTLLKYSLADQQLSPFAEGVMGAVATADGSKLLISGRGGFQLVSSEAPMAGPGGKIDFSDLSARIDPMQEWAAEYHEVWRKERILFYDPGLHGIDSFEMEKRYEPFLKNLRSRADLNYLFTDMMGEICIAHMFIGGGDIPAAPRVNGGLLGADFTFENGRYRIARVYDGESWNPDLYSPLGNAGVRAKKGEYILAINGKELTQTNDIYLALENKAGRRVSVKLGPNPDGTGSREVALTPIASERALRNKAWEEDNRRYVSEQTGGRCGYIVVPDTNLGGWQAFMRYYYAQYDKDAIIIDERFNSGGAINDFMVREMEKPLDFYGATRYGDMFKVPNTAVYGPKVMLINEMAGSGGDIFPYIFQQHKTGKLIGHRTWGGELSAFGFPVIDGGTVRAPEDAQFDIKTGQYVIENVGTSPDIAVEFDPAMWRSGVDSQLKVAVEEIKKEMVAHPPVKLVRPKYPDKSKVGKSAGG